MDLFSSGALAALLEIIAINVVLSGDNAVVIGLAAAGLQRSERGKAILFGIVAATILRIVFAVIATRLLRVFGLVLVGGFLLLWVTWKMWTELQEPAQVSEGEISQAGGKTLLQAVVQIVVADVSMSLDNVLAVAGAASQNTPVLVIGLIISIALMGFAASLIARLLDRYRWIAYLGLAAILYVAVTMVWDGAKEVWPIVAEFVAQHSQGAAG